MRRVVKVFLTIILWALFCTGAEAGVFHGYDKDTGTKISRAAVDTVSPPDGLKIGFKIVKVQGGQITVAFTSLDEKLKQLDAPTAFLLIDGQYIPLRFKGYNTLIIHDSLPPMHEIWFGPIEQDTLKKISDAKKLSLSISTISGIPINRDFSEWALADVKEVIRGAPR